MANYAFTEFCELPASVDDAYAQLTDLEFIQHSYQQREGVVINVQPGKTDCSVIVTRPVGPQLIGLGLQLRLEQHWHESNKGKTADIAYKLLGTPIQINGAMQLSASATGSTLSALLNVRVALPFVGSALARKLAGIAQEKVAADFAYQRDALAAANSGLVSSTAVKS